MKEIKATGVFFDDANLNEIKSKVSELPFGRFGYEPKPLYIPVIKHPGLNEVNEELLGEKVTVQVVGYGRNYGIEAFLVRFYPIENVAIDKIVRETFISNKPAILISASPRKTKISTNELNFWPIEKPFIIDGYYGAITKDNSVMRGISEGDVK